MQQISALALTLLATTASLPAANPAQPASIAQVWSGQPVPFSITTSKARLYIGYYGADRALMIASRAIGGGKWQYRRLDTSVGWDSHRAIALAVDQKGRLHIAANMHASPLTFFMSAPDGSLGSIKRVPMLVAAASEQAVTYPTFLKARDGRLIFLYRAGRSGAGDIMLDAFDAQTGRWRRLINSPLMAGDGERNAYPMGPSLGPDGWFHMSWVWRDNWQAQTTHDLSYAKSRDLVHWVSADGTALDVPIKLGARAIVDPVPVNGGIVNSNTPFGFDADGRVMIAYHKYDADGNTQVYLARWEGAGWHIVQASDWKGFRWDLSGGGTLNGVLSVKAPRQIGAKIEIPLVRQAHPGRLYLAANSLARAGQVDGGVQTECAPWPSTVIGAGMMGNAASAAYGNREYRISWATMPANRDQPRATVPPATTLWFSERSAVKC